MKKVLLTGVALMLAGGVAAPVFAADATPGFTVTGDARMRMYYKSDEYANTFGNSLVPAGSSVAAGSQTNMDTRIRFDLTGTAAGGAYVKGRIRMMESTMSAMDTDLNGINGQNQNNIWADKAYMGVPITKDITIEVGKYRSTYGPLPTTYNFFYDDVQLAGARGIIKIGDVVINPFFEWMTDGQNSGITSSNAAQTSSATDKANDNDEMRMGAHVKAKLNKDWTIGGMLGYQMDNRVDTATATGNQGAFGSIYVNGTAGAFGIVGELAYTAAKLNGFNTWAEDANVNGTFGSFNTTTGTTGTEATQDMIGSKNDGYGGYINPTFTIDKLTLGVNAGFTKNGFRPDVAYGFVMIGGKDNSIIGDSVRIGETGDWLWAGLSATYAISNDLKVTGNFVYADVDSVDITSAGAVTAMKAGQGDVPYTTAKALDSAYELSAIMQYTISKGADLFLSAGYLKPDFTNPALKTDAALGVASRLEIAF